MNDPPILNHPILGEIVVLGKIARGGYASIWNAYCVEMKTHVCLKIDEKRKAETENEFRMMKLLNHPLTCQFYGEFKSGDNVGAVLEFIEGSTILDFINKNGVIKENYARYLFAELVSIIQHLHCELGMIHQDLKCENIIIDTHNNLHLIDFGFAHLDSDNLPLSYRGFGTPGYIPPEVIKGNRYTFSSDIFSIGVLLYSMLVGRLPFSGTNSAEIFHHTVTDPVNYPETISDDVIDLLDSLLDKDPIKRPNISQILLHNWLNPIIRGIKLIPSFEGLRKLDKYPDGKLDQEVLNLFNDYGYSVENLLYDINHHIDTKLVAYYLFLRNIQISNQLSNIQITLFIHQSSHSPKSTREGLSKSTPGFGHQNQAKIVQPNLSLKIKNQAPQIIQPNAVRKPNIPKAKK